MTQMQTVMWTCLFPLPTLEISTQQRSISKAANSQGDEKQQQTDPVRDSSNTQGSLGAVTLTSVNLGLSPT